MKKILSLILINMLCFMTVSCSSDDNSDDNTGSESQLVLYADNYNIKVGETVSFTVELNKTRVTSAKIYIGDEEIGYNKTFTKEGSYNIIAKKEGALNSKSITIVVSKEGVSTNDIISIRNKKYNIAPSLTKLYAETILDKDEHYVRVYEIETELGIVKFCKFVVEVRTPDFEIQNDKSVKGALSRIYKIVIQNEGSDKLIYPGMSGAEEININGFIVSESGNVEFKEDAIKSLEVKLAKFLDENGHVNVDIQTSDSNVKYTGRIASMYAIDTTNDKQSKSLKGIETTTNFNRINELSCVPVLVVRDRR